MDWYLWIKALHVIAVISWMAGLLYLPRLMVYHTDSVIGDRQSETFKIMERRLYFGIMYPAMIITWCSGLGLAWITKYFVEFWFLLKLGFVVILTFAHLFFGKELANFRDDLRVRKAIFYRLVNEIPTVLLILIVVLVIIKPF